MEDDENEEENALFEEDDSVELHYDRPPHLHDLATAAELGDLDALRLALASPHYSPKDLRGIVSGELFLHKLEEVNKSVKKLEFLIKKSNAPLKGS